MVGVEYVGHSKTMFSVYKYARRELGGGGGTVQAQSGTSSLEVQRRLSWGLSPVSEDKWECKQN